MPKVPLSPDLIKFIEGQPIYFVATAPLSKDGHVNCSPKGGTGTFKVISPLKVAYIDYVGSGVETVAHLKENGRIVVMFASFGSKPKIVRIHGKGSVREAGSLEFRDISQHFQGSLRGARCVVEISVEEASTSCGYGVPLMQYMKDRETMSSWLASKGQDGLRNYVKKKNSLSIDHLRGLEGTEVAF